jgi:hypothetical protein
LVFMPPADQHHCGMNRSSILGSCIYCPKKAPPPALR